jgi:hypothetical protein
MSQKTIILMLIALQTSNLNFDEGSKEIRSSGSFRKIQKIICDIKIWCGLSISLHAAILAWGWSFGKTGRKMR